MRYATFFIIGIVLQSNIAIASIKNLGTHGAVYGIAEKDLLDEIKERAAAVDWNKVFNKDEFEKKVTQWKPDALPSLQKASKSDSFTVDLTYALNYDIPDGKGGVLYPKGYTFNPLDLVNYPLTLVVIDGSDNDQVVWFKTSEYNSHNTKLLLSGGSWYDLSKQLKRPVFYINQAIIDRFRIKAVPSVIYQEGKVMRVKEYYARASKK